MLQGVALEVLHLRWGDSGTNPSLKDGWDVRDELSRIVGTPTKSFEEVA